MTLAPDLAFEPDFRGLICVSFGTRGAEMDRGASPAPARTRWYLHFGSADPESLGALKSLLGQACVGVRLMLAGPQADIQAARSAAVECGVVDEEMTLLDGGTGPHRVFCAHCRFITESTEAVGSLVDCGGCATSLVISDHFSRRMAGYLGFAANAEEGT